VVAVNTLLTSGVSASFSLPAVGSFTVFKGESGYRIVVPPGARRLEVRLVTTTPAVNLDLYVRFGSDLGGGCPPDYCSEGQTGNEVVIVTGECSDPSLQAGTYYIALAQNTTGRVATGTLTATVYGAPTSPPSTGTLLTSGIRAPFSFSAVAVPTLFRGSSSYRVVVPPGSTQLQVVLSTATPGVDMDLFVRLGADVEETGDYFVADYCSQGSTGSETITATPSSPTPLIAGTYFVSLLLFTTGEAAAGTVTATVTTGPFPVIDISQTGALDFGAVTVGQTKDLALTIRNTGTAALTVNSIPPSNPQFTVPSPARPFTLVAGGQQTVVVRFAPTSAGQKTGTLTIASNDPVRPSVELSIQGTGGSLAPPVIAVSVNAVNFNAQVGASPPSQTFTVRNTGGGTLNFQVAKSQSWLTVSPAQGASAGVEVSISVSVNTSGLAAGTYTDDVRVTDQGTPPATAQVIRVTLVVTPAAPQPAIGVSATSLLFTAQQGANPPPQTLEVRNAGGGTLNFQVTANRPWLSASPDRSSTTGPGVSIQVSVNTAGLSAGEQTGEIRVLEAAGPPAALSDPSQVAPVTIPVRLNITTSAPPPTAPIITRGGIVNAASFVSSGLPGGAIARGSIFSLFGTRVGPASLVTVSAFPLATTLGGVSLRVSRGATSVDAIPLAVTATQINAIMPSNAPLGEATITVTYNGVSSVAVSVRVEEASFGAFTVQQSGMGPGIIQNYVPQIDQPLNSTVQTARPRQVVTLWGTGLGAINTADSAPPPVGNVPGSLEIFVGGKLVTNRLYGGRAPCCAGLDQIVFEVPDDAPQGCHVPVLVRAGNVTSNAVTMAIDAEAGPCRDAANPLAGIAVRGGRQGAVSLVRINVRRSDPGQSPQTLRVDLGSASFREERGGEFFFDPLGSLPPPGSCTVFSGRAVDLSVLLSGRLPGLPTPSRALDAGASLQVLGLSGQRTIPRSADASGGYLAVLGTTNPAPGQPSLPLFLDDASYMVEGSGGSEVDPFRADVRLPPQVNWSNRDLLSTVNRTQGVTLTWAGGEGSLQAITILGGNVDSQTNASGMFLCVSSLATGVFTVPAAVLSSLPPSNLQQPGQSVGFLFLGTVPTGDIARFTARGLDAGFAFFSSWDGITTTFR